MEHPAVLGIEGLTYVFGAIYILAQSDLKSWEVEGPTTEASAIPGNIKGLSIWSPSSLIVSISILTAYFLKGLPPLVAGNPKLTAALDLDSTLRQTLWAFEALAGVSAGLIYRRLHDRDTKRKFFALGLVNGMWLLINFLSLGYFGFALSLFSLSLFMTLAFMKLRDDFIAQYHDKAAVLWATGLVNMVMNTALTVSPLAIGIMVESLGVLPSVFSVIALQIGIYFGLRFWWFEF